MACLTFKKMTRGEFEAEQMQLTGHTTWEQYCFISATVEINHYIDYTVLSPAFGI